MNDLVYAASPLAVHELLDGGGEFVEPARILQDLSEDQATVVPAGSPYSIAQVLNHTHFYQNATMAGIRGKPWHKPEHLDDTFAPVEPGSWQRLVSDFLAGIENCKQLALQQAEERSPARNDTNVAYDLAESALHNAYHLGQVVLLRRMLGCWPPAGGEDYDF